jgi:lipid-binding SYLF domain-containing protein
MFQTKENHMMTTTRRNILVLVMMVFALSIGVFSKNAKAESAQEIRAKSSQALKTLYRTNPVAHDISKHAKAVLVFPSIVKAGLVIGGAYGEGALYKGSNVAGYYKTMTGSWGLQAGAQSYGYVVFLMSDKAVSYLARSEGWEIGVGPTVVIVNEGVAKNLSTSTLKDDAYAFIFNQQGLMVGLSIEGSKITRIKR